MPSQVTTTDATTTTLWSATGPVDNTHVLYEARVTARSTSGQTASYIRYVSAKHAGGTTSIVGSVGAPFTAEDNSAWDAIFAIVSGRLHLRVTGAAATTITWTLQSLKANGDPLGTYWDAS